MFLPPNVLKWAYVECLDFGGGGHSGEADFAFVTANIEEAHTVFYCKAVNFCEG